MNTTYLETCCKVLEGRMEYPSDGYLVKLVRVQQLAQSISLSMAIENISQHSTRIPLTSVARSFQDQLNSFSGTHVPPGVEDRESRHVLLVPLSFSLRLLTTVCSHT